MEEEEYQEIARFLQEQLRAHGLGEIAEFRDYEIDTPDGRFMPDGRKLVSLMLRSLDRVVALHDDRIVEEALESIRGAIDEGDKPETALVHFDRDSAAEIERREEPERVTGLQTVPIIRSELQELEELLINIDREPPEDGGVLQ